MTNLAGIVRDAQEARGEWMAVREGELALTYAEAMTITGQKVSDELFGRLRAHFSEPELVELTAAVALENFRSKFNVALGIEAQGFCVLTR